VDGDLRLRDGGEGTEGLTELEAGLAFWLASHPDWAPEENWPEEVMCARYETADAVVLVDPQLWPDGGDAFLGLGERPVRVLLTSPWHERDAHLFVDRYGASVWAPPRARWKGPSPKTTDELPAGVEAIEPAGDRNQALFFFREQRTLFTGDVFSGTGGRFHVFIDEDDIAEEDRGSFLDSLERLADLPVERVLIAHGESIFEGGAARIRAAVEEARA
jgi:glyoxylase-like metal-dependent hydrolase (beta-lactamase superfamily II)